jgi:hypothetical protein
MIEMKKLLPCLLLSLLACGATEEQLRTRAAFDMKCPESELRITDIDDRTKGVRGCDQQGTYVESCAHERQDCTWVLNSDAQGRSRHSKDDD